MKREGKLRSIVAGCGFGFMSARMRVSRVLRVVHSGMKWRFAISEHIHQASVAQVDVQVLFTNSTAASHTNSQRFVRPILSFGKELKQ